MMLGTLVLSNALVRLSLSCFIQEIFTIKYRNNRRKTEQMYKVFWPSIYWRGPRLLYGRLL